MKQVYLLDKHDLTALRAGEPFEIHVAGQVIVLRAEGARRNGHEPAPVAEKRSGGKGVPHRQFSKAFKAEVLAYAKAHDVTTAAKKFKVDNGSIYKWRQGKGFGGAK